MPQLMPLNWIFSMLMMFLLMMSAVMVYSNSFNFMKKNEIKNKVENNMNWCW